MACGPSKGQLTLCGECYIFSFSLCLSMILSIYDNTLFGISLQQDVNLVNRTFSASSLEAVLSSYCLSSQPFPSHPTPSRLPHFFTLHCTVSCLTLSPSISFTLSFCTVSHLNLSYLILSYPTFSPSLHIGIVGLKDPLREGVVEAVHRIQDSGAKVHLHPSYSACLSASASVFA